MQEQHMVTDLTLRETKVGPRPNDVHLVDPRTPSLAEHG